MLGVAGSYGGIYPKVEEYSVGVIVRLIGAAVAILCITDTSMTPLSSLPSSPITLNVTTVYHIQCSREKLRERVSVSRLLSKQVSTLVYYSAAIRLPGYNVMHIFLMCIVHAMHMQHCEDMWLYMHI